MQRGPWRDDEPLECTMAIPEAPNVWTFAFRAPSGAWFDYLPGQFVTLEIPTASGPIIRTYTISSTPSRPMTLSVTAKAQGDSVATRWMAENLRPGMRVKASGPAGGFTISADPRGRKFLFIAAGSGVTPLMSMLSYIFDYGDRPDARLISCARRPSELIFRRRLEHMAGRVPGIRVSHVVSEEEDHEVWTGYLGRFNQLMLGLMAPDYLDREVYCCGPEGFMQSVREALNALGYDMARYHQESFHAPAETRAAQPPTRDVIPQEAQVARIDFARSGVTVSCTETDTILSIAQAEALGIPFGCTFGVCGTCKIRKLSGEVHMVHNGGISEDDVAAGYILPCCSHPIGRVKVDA